MEQSTLIAIAAVTGLIGAIGGLFAAIAAFRSAGSAKDAVKRIHEVERRRLLRDMTTAANNVVAESIRVDDIGNKLKLAYNNLANFSGQFNSGRQKMYIGRVEKKQNEVAPLQREALIFLDLRDSNSKQTERELYKQVTKFESYLIQILRTKEQLSQDLESVEQENQAFRSKAI